jgi:NADH:ubiquinone oxidoreductase subunit F (NADH-binding)
VHDVETLVGVLPILALGAPAYPATGTEKSTGLLGGWWVLLSREVNQSSSVECVTSLR